MSNPAIAVADQGQGKISVHLPMFFRRRGGRKLVVIPGDQAHRPRPSGSPIVSPLLKAVVRAHRWARLLEHGEFGSIAELAAAERVDKSYLSKVLRLTLLGPSLVERILNGNESEALRIERLLQPFPNEWQKQAQLVEDEALSRGRRPRDRRVNRSLT